MLFYVLVISQSLVIINTPYTNPQSRARGGVASPVAPPSSSQPDLVLLRAWAHILQPSPGSDFPGTKAGKEPVKETAGQENTNKLIPFLSTLYPLNYCLFFFFLTYDMIFFFVSIFKIFILRTAKQRKNTASPSLTALTPLQARGHAHF